MSTHCGIVKPYGNVDLGQHWLRYFFLLRHQTITWTNIDSSSGLCGMHLRAISQEVLKNSICEND